METIRVMVVKIVELGREDNEDGVSDLSDDSECFGNNCSYEGEEGAGKRVVD